MIRLIIFVIILWLLWPWIQRFIRKKLPYKKPSLEKTEKMQRCELCGVYVPENEAIKSGDHYFCCEQHKNQG